MDIDGEHQLSVAAQQAAAVARRLKAQKEKALTGVFAGGWVGGWVGGVSVCVKHPDRVAGAEPLCSTCSLLAAAAAAAAGDGTQVPRPGSKPCRTVDVHQQ
jgi:hypothetical protein